MAFIEYKTAGCKEQVRDLLRLRLKLKDDIRRHKKLIAIHKEKINIINSIDLIEVENKLNFYLDRVNNEIKSK